MVKTKPRQATIKLGIDTLTANILVFLLYSSDVVVQVGYPHKRRHSR